MLKIFKTFVSCQHCIDFHSMNKDNVEMCNDGDSLFFGAC